MLRILELVRSLEKGGRTVRLLNGAMHLRERGFAVTVASFRPPVSWVSDCWPTSSSVTLLDPRRRIDPRCIAQILRISRAKGITVIHAHSEDAYLYGGIAAHLLRIPIVGTFHRSSNVSYEKRWSSRIWNRLLWHQVAVSDDRRQAMLRLTGAPAERVSVIHGGVDTRRFRPVSAETKTALRRTLNIPMDELVILGIGHLGPIKGHDVTLRAYAALRRGSTLPGAPSRLYLVGDGSATEQTNLQTLTAELGIRKSVVMLGQVRNPEDWLGACDLFVQPSREEAFGLVFAEAAAAGVPVVATRVGGIPEIVRDGETGVLVKPEDAPALTNAIRILLADPAKRACMGRKARTRAKAHFSLEAMADAYTGLFTRQVPDVRKSLVSRESYAAAPAASMPAGNE